MKRIIQTTGILCLMLLWCSGIQAQFSISGTITDKAGEPLIGASILEKGTTNGTVADIEGKFALAVKDSLATLLVSYTGFSTKEIALKGTSDVKILLSEADVSLEEVTVSASRSRRSRAKHSSRRSKKIAASSYVSEATSYESVDVATRSTSDAMASVSEAVVNENQLTSGTLTAGEINDFQKWNLWEDIAGEDLNKWQKYWQINPSERYSMQLISSDNSAVTDAQVQLLDGQQVIWQSRSDNTGKAELWANLYGQKTASNKLSIEVNYEGKSYAIKQAQDFQKGVNMLTIPTNCNTQNKQVDIAFVVDATGSMGDEIEYLKVELNDIIEKAKAKASDLDFRLGTVFYRDEGESEAYLTRTSTFSSKISKTTSFIKEQSAGGGGDFPEAVTTALETAIDSMAWSDQAIGRFLFLVLDAPPHHNPEVLERLKVITKKAAAKGIRIIPVTGSGIDKSTEYLMRTFSLMTNGTYVFLTDHSGVGNPHIEPTTDTYDVEKLNDLLVRLIHQYTYQPSCDNTDLHALNAPDKEVKAPNSKDGTALSWTYFPNPTSGQLRVEVKGELEHIYLTDFSGKILQRYQVNKNNSLDLNIGQYPSGIYFLMARNGEKNLKGKIILARQA